MSSKLPTDGLVLAGECDLRCWFCDERRGGGLSGEAAARAELEHRGPVRGRALRISGCDPVRRGDLTGLIRLARGRGYGRVGVVTSGMRLADPAAVRALIDAGADAIVTTVYSREPRVHDTVCGRPGAHARLQAAFAELARHPVDVRLRVPLLAPELQHLPDLLAGLLLRLPRVAGVEPYLSQSVPRIEGIERLLPPAFTALAATLTETLGLLRARGVPVTILPRSGIPFCAVPGEHRSAELLPHRRDAPEPRDPADRLGSGCEPCAMLGPCGGARSWHLAHAGEEQLVPLRAPIAASPVRSGAEPLAGRTAARSAGRFRVVLVNLCEDTCGYGPGASEYLRATLLATPDLAARVDCEILFLADVGTDEAARRILQLEPSLVGFTCYSWNLRANGEVSRALRRDGIGCPIVWGGCSFAFFDRDHDWFAWWDCVDAVAIGSGEYTLVDLVRHLLERPQGGIERALPGLALLRDGRREVGPPARLPRDLDELASPYLAGPVYRVERPTVEMARGCRFECTFCSDARSSRENRMLMHSVDRLAAEIDAITRWPVARWIDAGASTANVTDEAFEIVCEAIRRGDPAGKLKYGFQLYPAIARERQRDALRGVNVGSLYVGVQSLTPATFRAMRRGTTLEHLQRAIDVFSPAETVELSVLLGLPGETLQSFKTCFDRLLQYPVRLVINRLLVLPGTQLHLHRRAWGIEYDRDLYYRIVRSDTMSADDLRRAQDHVVERAQGLPDLLLDGEARVRWVNFDVQRCFSAPSEFGRPDLFA